jgi:hypothetical protein
MIRSTLKYNRNRSNHFILGLICSLFFACNGNTGEVSKPSSEADNSAFSNNSNVKLNAEQDNNKLNAEQGNNKLNAEQGNNKLNAEQGNNKLNAEQDNNKLNAEQDNNKLNAEQEARIASAFTPSIVYSNDVEIPFIRVGNQFGDGGYLVPIAAIENSSALMSYGVADDISFDEDFLRINTTANAYLFDCSVDSLPKEVDRISFKKECIGSSNFIPEEPGVKEEKVVTDYAEQLNSLNLTNDNVFIKMDIEGAEYEAFNGITDTALATVQGIVMELHHLDNYQKLQAAVELAFRLKKFFFLVHIHPNNHSIVKKWSDLIEIPEVIEVTWINRKLVTKHELFWPGATYRHPLDRKCGNHGEDIFLKLFPMFFQFYKPIL